MRRVEKEKKKSKKDINLYICALLSTYILLEKCIEAF